MPSRSEEGAARLLDRRSPRALAHERLPGAAGIAVAIVLNLAAAAIQASNLSVSRPWPLDHNGLFHLVQIVALGVLAPSLRTSLLKTPAPAPTSRPG